MTTPTYTPAAVSRLLNAVLHPETVEGWQEPNEARGPEWTPDAFAAGEPDDPRTEAERNLDEWQAEWRETYSSLRVICANRIVDAITTIRSNNVQASN